MLNIVEFKKEIFKTTADAFHVKALELFRFQAEYNNTYREFLQYLDIDPASVSSISEIPYLPVEFFKSRKIITGDHDPDFYFESSGTTSEINSKHFIADKNIYNESIRYGFERIYGDIKQYCFLALLPSYLERKNASLVYMVDQLMQISNHESNGFYLNDTDALIETIKINEKNNIPTMLIGVSFAVTDLAEKYAAPLKNTIIMETGGMKGRRTEITREELHDLIKQSFHVDHVHSEYGMTELLSQCYAKQNGIFHAPPWMHISIRNTEDPFELLGNNITGCINIIDIANVHSCAFIATQDLGKINSENTFQVLGRFDNSDIRGCNLLV